MLPGHTNRSLEGPYLKINSTIVGQGLSGARWRLADSDQALLARLGHETGESELLLRCLTNRGLASSEQISSHPTSLPILLLLQDCGTWRRRSNVCSVRFAHGSGS
jgi:hypothetical protein